MKMNKIILFVIMMMTPILMFAKEVKNNKLDGGGNARYKIHTTPATKKIVVRGGAKRLYRFSCGVACVKYEKGWFVVDKQGNKVFDFPEGFLPVGAGFGYREDENVEFSNDRMLLSKDIKYGSKNLVIIDKKGTIIKDLGIVERAYPFVDGIGRIMVSNGYGKKSGTYYINTNGDKIITNTPVTEIYHLSDGLRCYQDPSTKKWGFIDANCNIVIPAKYKDVGRFYNGLAYAKNNEGLWGYINKSGEWAIQPQYTNEVGTFKGPYARVYDKTGCSYYIDKKGNIVWKNPNPKEIECQEYLPEGYALWSIPVDNASSHQLAIVNSSFTSECIIADGYACYYEVLTSNSRWFQLNGGRCQLFDWKGNLLLDFNTDHKKVDVFSEDVCSSKGMDKDFYFNDKGEIIVIFEDTLF